MNIQTSLTICFIWIMGLIGAAITDTPEVFLGPTITTLVFIIIPTSEEIKLMRGK